eukprot:jgi/Ulvmu1/9229/UM005_0329.1
MTASLNNVLCGVVAWMLASPTMVFAFNVDDLFIPVDIHEYGGTDPLEQQVWELVMAPIEETSLVTCTKRVHGESSGAWVNAPPIYLEAVAEAVKYACTADSPTVADIAHVYASGSLYAVSEAVAQASIACQSINAERECFSLEASTTAFASASMELHAEAIAKAAVAECSCDETAVWAWASGYAHSHVYEELVASAKANVEVEVCVEGDGTFVDSAYDTCTESITAELFARATASAIAGGSCQTATAGIHALTSISGEVHVYTTCDDEPDNRPKNPPRKGDKKPDQWW